MAVEHVEINQICKNEPLRALGDRFGEFRHAIGIILCRNVIVHASPVVNVVDLADAEHRSAALGEKIEQHWLRRLDGIVMAPLRALKIAWLSCKRTRDHATHAIGSVKNL